MSSLGLRILAGYLGVLGVTLLFVPSIWQRLFILQSRTLGLRYNDPYHALPTHRLRMYGALTVVVALFLVLLDFAA